MDGQWIPIEEWSRCVEMERPGIVFEVQNDDGQGLLTRCTPVVPEAPFDWTSPPVRFRAVPAEPPRHSSPIPRPKKL